MDEIILAYPYIEAVAIQRMTHVFYQPGLRSFHGSWRELIHSRTRIDIHPGVKIGSHFFYRSRNGVVTGEPVKLGNR